MVGFVSGLDRSMENPLHLPSWRMPPKDMSLRHQSPQAEWLHLSLTVSRVATVETILSPSQTRLCLGLE